MPLGTRKLEFARQTTAGYGPSLFQYFFGRAPDDSQRFAANRTRRVRGPELRLLRPVAHPPERLRRWATRPATLQVARCRNTFFRNKPRLQGARAERLPSGGTHSVFYRQPLLYPARFQFTINRDRRSRARRRPMRRAQRSLRSLATPPATGFLLKNCICPRAGGNPVQKRLTLLNDFLPQQARAGYSQRPREPKQNTQRVRRPREFHLDLAHAKRAKFPS